MLTVDDRVRFRTTAWEARLLALSHQHIRVIQALVRLIIKVWLHRRVPVTEMVALYIHALDVASLAPDNAIFGLLLNLLQIMDVLCIRDQLSCLVNVAWIFCSSGDWRQAELHVREARDELIAWILAIEFHHLIEHVVVLALCVVPVFNLGEMDLELIDFIAIAPRIFHLADLVSTSVDTLRGRSPTKRRGSELQWLFML